MDTSTEQNATLIERTFQSASAYFLTSFGDLLHAASLLERRPKSPAQNPDIDQSIKKARWWLLAAIESFDALATASAGNVGRSPTKKVAGQPDVTSILAQAVEHGVLVDSPQASKLISQLVSSQDSNQVIPALRAELAACQKALDRLDPKSDDLALRLHMAFSAYANGLIKGQYVSFWKTVR